MGVRSHIPQTVNFQSKFVNLCIELSDRDKKLEKWGKI